VATTLAQLRTRVRYFVRDPNTKTFQDAELDIYINEAQKEVAAFLCKNEGDFLLREATTTLVQGTTDYHYPSDIFGRNIRALYAYGTDPVTYVKVQRGTLEEVYDAGMVQDTYPSRYVCLDGYFKVGPPPDDSGYTLLIAYIRQPTDLASGTDVMDSDDEFKELIAVSAAIRALETRGGKESVELLAGRQQALLAEAARLITKEDLIQGYPAWEY